MKLSNVKMLALATIILTITIWKLSSDSEDRAKSPYNELAKKINLKHELVKPKAKQRVLSSRGPSSIDNFDDDLQQEALPSKTKKKSIFKKFKAPLLKAVNEARNEIPYGDFFVGEEVAESKPNKPKDDVTPVPPSSRPYLPPETDNPNTKSSGGSGNNTIVTPAISGTIPPLKGIVTNVGYSPFSAYAATCVDPKVELFDMVTMTPLEDNPIELEGVETTTYFEFDPSVLGLDLSKPARYKVKVTGCDVDLEKVVTSFYIPQDITSISSLLAQLTNTDIAYDPDLSFSTGLGEVEKAITDALGDPTISDYATIYSELSSNTQALETFTEITNGENTIILKDSAPKVKSLTIPASMEEDLSHSFSTLATHWDTDYEIAYQWILDGATVSNSNTWDYIPPDNTAATANIILRIGKKNIADNDVNIATAPYHEFTYTLDVLQINDAPTLAATQSIDVTEDTIHTFQLTEGFDIDSPSIDYIITTPPSNGTLSCVGTTNDCTYTPNPDYQGADTFEYKVNDGELDSTTAVVSINVINVNDRPVSGADQSLSIAEDTNLSITLSAATDIDNVQSDISYMLVNTPVNGTLSNCIVSGSYSQDLTCDYLPNANYYGTDSFSYKAYDGALDSATNAVVNITITPVNDAPTLASTQTLSTDEDTTLNFDLTAGADIEGTTLNYTILTNPASGTLNCTEGTSRSCTYSPALNYFGDVTFTYKVDDGELDSLNVNTVTITVNPINDAPVMGADQTLATNEDIPLNFTLSSATDVDIPAQTISYKLLTAPVNGVLSNCIQTGSYVTDIDCTYTPNANYYGSDSFTYIANDSVTDAVTIATVTLNIAAVNDAPTLAATQSVTTNEDTPVAFTLNSGSDIEGTTLNYTIVSAPADGTLTCDEGTSRNCSYSPDLNFYGTTTFTYKVDDGELDSTLATVTINVTSENDAPVMVGDQSETVAEDNTISITLSGATDVDIPVQTLSYKLITAPANGTLSNCISAGTYTTDIICDYTPNLNFNGSDSFTYRANDGLTDSSTDSTVSITVTPVNDAPTLVAGQTVTTAEDTPITFNLNIGSDVEGSSLDYIVVTTTSNGSLSCVGATSRSCTYSPSLNFNGSDSFTYKVNDGALDSTTETVSITVNPVNDAPVMVGNQSVATNEDTLLSITLSGATDVDLPAQTLSYKLITAPSNGVLSNCISAGSYTTDIICDYLPSANFNGSDSFTYRANDTLLDSVTDSTVTITINAVNDAPTLIAGQTVSTNEDTPVSFSLNAGSDIENDTLTYAVVAAPSNGSLSCTGGTSRACTYTPSLNYNGSDSFTYKVNDGSLDSNIVTVNITVNAINDAPVMVSDQSFTTNEDTAFSITLSGATDVDLPAQTISYKITTSPTNGTITNCINSSTYTTDIICTYTPNANFNGSDSFTYIANDGLIDATSSSIVSLTINPVNDQPTVPPTQSIATNEDTPITFNLNAGSDIDGDTLTYIKVTNPASGSVTCAGGTSRSCTYTPALNYNGVVSFTYKVNDGTIDSANATVSITVNSVNDAPVMASNQSYSTNDNTALSITLNNATDVDGDALTYKIVSGPTNGTLTNCITTGSYGTDLTCTYTSNINFHGTDTFTFIANDGLVDAATVETVTITVTDKTPSAPPTIALSSPLYTNSTANTLTVSSCSDISSVLINEGTQPAAGSASWQTCSTTASAITYTLASTTQGLHTLKAWSKDPHGNVSTTANNVSVYYDTINPSMALTTPSIQKGGNSTPLQWTATDASTSSSQTFQVDFFNGSTWSSVGTTASANGPISSQAFSRAWTVPSINTTSARFRVSYTDLAGNSATVQSATFTIDSIAPALSYTSPANNSYHLSSTTITGNCESGLNINISGDLQANFSIACSGGTFSQLVNFSDNDGAKNITINQVDAAGNSTSVTRTFIRDEIAPVLTKTAGVSPDFTNANVPNAWSGTCEGTYTIYVTGDQTTSFNCSNGTWNWTPSPKTVDGTYTYNLVQTDGAGNTSSPALSLSWERDATPPDFNATSPVAISVGQNISRTVLMDSITVSGTCEGNNVIAITGAQSDTITCSSNSWTWTSQSYTTDATRAFTFTQSDSAGNTSALTYTWTRDSNFPALGINVATVKNNGSTATFSGTCENGLTINITGSQATTTTCSSGVWSWTTASTATDVNNTYNFAQTNASSNTSTVTGYWYRETGLPVVNSIVAGVADPSPTNFVPYALTASSQNANVFITHVCMKSDDTTTPPIDDACWIAVNSSSIGIVPAQNVTIPEYSYLVGWEPALYSVYAWVKDEAGNISTNTATQDTDLDSIIYTKDDPPLIWDVAAANNDTSAIPPTRTETSVPTGSDLYIRWKVDDAIGLSATSINLFYTQDEQVFTAIAGAQGIAPHTNHGCEAISLAANEGCFKWTGGSPLATAYKIRVKVTNTSGISTQLTSTPLNADKIKIIAGNTEAGLGGDARTALFFNKVVGDSADIQSLVFTDDGNIYFADYKRGIITVDPADGKQKLFIQKTGTSTGDGGPAESATLRFPLKVTLDYQGRLLIWDYNRIRRVDLNLENPTIETIIGGGTNTADTVANPLDLQMYNVSTSDYRTNGAIFTTLPNGDLWFTSDRPESTETTDLRLRIYKAATGQVISKYLTGTGDAWIPTQDISKCRLGFVGVKFDPTTSAIQGIKGTTYHHPNFPDCGMYTSTSDYNYSNAYFDPTTGQAITPPDNSYRWYHYYNFAGMDGQMYVTVARSYMNRNNFDGTYTRILGSGTRGECADGTLATACNMDIYGVFVDKNGKVYFNDRGRIRTLDADGKVVTIFGQGYSYGDGVNAVNARFGNVSRVARLDNGKIFVNETASYYLKEFTIEGNIDIIAGNGTIATQNTTDQANTQPMRSSYWAIADKATGNIYSTRDDHYGRMAMLNRSTGIWEDIFTNSSGTNYASADGMVAGDIDIGGNQNRALPVGFANGHLFQSFMKYDASNNRYDGFMMKSFNSADSYRQAHIIGTTGYGSYGPNESCVELRTGPVSGTTCEFEYWDNYRNIVYDSVDQKYVTAKMYRGAERRVLAFKNGTVEQIAYTARNINDGWTYVRRGGTQYLYYCYGNRLYAHNIDTNTDLGALEWSMPQLSCRGMQFDYNPTNDSILFPFEQNGLYGVAEYFLP